MSALPRSATVPGMTYQTQSMAPAQQAPQYAPMTDTQKRLTRIEIAVWLSMSFAFVAMVVGLYWSWKVYQMIHALQQALQ